MRRIEPIWSKKHLFVVFCITEKDWSVVCIWFKMLWIDMIQRNVLNTHIIAVTCLENFLAVPEVKIFRQKTTKWETFRAWNRDILASLLPKSRKSYASLNKKCFWPRKTTQLFLFDGSNHKQQLSYVSYCLTTCRTSGKLQKNSS